MNAWKKPRPACFTSAFSTIYTGPKWPLAQPHFALIAHNGENQPPLPPTRPLGQARRNKVHPNELLPDSLRASRDRQRKNGSTFPPAWINMLGGFCVPRWHGFVRAISHEWFRPIAWQNVETMDAGPSRPFYGSSTPWHFMEAWDGPAGQSIADEGR